MKWPFGMAESGKVPEALMERPDVARGLENLPVSVWPSGAGPEPFQVRGRVWGWAWAAGRLSPAPPDPQEPAGTFL